jgi:hypothetical protein
MTLQQRQEKLIRQISALKDEEVLIMLEQELSFFTQTAGKDITENLNSCQVKELISLVNEPSERNVINEDDFKTATEKWRSK